MSTAPGEGALALVRLSGRESIRIGGLIFRCRPPLGARTRRVEYGTLMAGGEDVDTGLAWTLRGPHSYTGEDMVEISCHGSPVVTEAVVGAAIAGGAALAEPGEFTRRAFLNGRLDLAQAEAVVDLIRAGAAGGARLAYGQASGVLSRWVANLRGRLVGVTTRLEAGLEFPEEGVAAEERAETEAELAAVREEVGALRDTYEGARRRLEGFSVVLVGRPNVGKSTLLNALLGEDRAIVTASPGTTRDLVEGRAVWGGLSVRVVDTAGIRRPGDEAEAAGVGRAVRAAAAADVTLMLFDGSAPWGEEDARVAAGAWGGRRIAVLTKADLPRRLGVRSAETAGLPGVSVSALRGEGLEELRSEVVRAVKGSRVVAGAAITRERHRESLERCHARLGEAGECLRSGGPEEVAVSVLGECLAALGEITGENVSAEVLDRIFAEFCIGK